MLINLCNYEDNLVYINTGLHAEKFERQAQKPSVLRIIQWITAMEALN